MPLTPTTTETAETTASPLTPPRREDHLTDELDEHTLKDELAEQAQPERRVSMEQLNPAFTGETLTGLSDWDRGDVAYGMTTPRETNLKSQLDEGRLTLSGHLSTADLFNNYFGLVDRAWTGIDPSASDAKVREDLSAAMEIDLDRTRAAAQDDTRPEKAESARRNLPLLTAYKAFMLDPTNPNNLVKAYRARPEERNTNAPLKRSVEGFIFKQKDEESENKARAYKVIRRACKAGLKMIHEVEPWKSNGAKVHFELKGMGDLALIARGAPIRQKSGRAAYVPITSTELRYAYDNRTNFTKVHYYIGAKEVHPPWSGTWTEADGVTAAADVWNAGRYGRRQRGGPGVIELPPGPKRA